MNRLRKAIKNNTVIIGMVHLLPLPGSPKYGGDLNRVYEFALNDLNALINGGANAIIVENFNDVPYAAENELINKISMAKIASKLREKCDLPMGINFQYNDVIAEWDIAYTCDYDFIRCEVFAENRMGPNGMFIASGPELMRHKAKYDKDIMILADVNVKHTFPIVDQPMEFTCEEIIDGGADGLIVTGLKTGDNPKLEDIKNIRKKIKKFPLFLGSGINKDNIKDYKKYINGAIVGSSLKENGIVTNKVDVNRVKDFMKEVNK